jgi:acetoin utilization protein AcuB
MQVKNLMTPNPFTIGSNQPVLEALLLMYERDIRRLPVVEKGGLVGIISDRDIRQIMGRPGLAISQPGEEPELKLAVSELMTRNLITVGEEDDVREAIELIVENKISGLPVLDRRQHLVGVISSIDILQYCLDLLEQVKGRTRN